MKPRLAPMAMAALIAMAVGAAAAEGATQHGPTALPADTGAPSPTSEAPPSPMPLSAEDMLGILETAPSHDDAHCCGTRKKDRGKNEHDH